MVKLCFFWAVSWCIYILYFHPKIHALFWSTPRRSQPMWWTLLRLWGKLSSNFKKKQSKHILRLDMQVFWKKTLIPCQQSLHHAIFWWFHDIRQSFLAFFQVPKTRRKLASRPLRAVFPTTIESTLWSSMKAGELYRVQRDHCGHLKKKGSILDGSSLFSSCLSLCF